MGITKMFANVGGPRALLNTLQLIPGGWISNPLRLFPRVPILDFGTLLPLISCHTPLFLVTLSFAHFTRYTVHGGATGVA